MRHFFKNSLITFFTEISFYFFNFIGLIIMARVLGPENKGIYSLILLIPSLLFSFGSFGIESANIYFTGAKKYPAKDVVSNSLVLSFILGIFLILVFFLFSFFGLFNNFVNFSQIPYFYLYIVVLTVPFSLLSNFFRGVIKGAGEIIDFNKSRIVEGISGLAAVVVLLLVLKQGISGAITSYVITLLCTLIAVIFLLRKISKLGVHLNNKLLKDSFIYGGKVYLANTISFLNYRLDMFLLAILLAPPSMAIQVGFYSIAVSIAEKMFIIPGALSTVLFPKISSSSSLEADNFTPKIVRHTFFIVLIASIALFFVAKPLIFLVFGSAFLPSVMPLLILLPGIIAFSIGGVIAADLSGRGKPQYAIYSSVGCLIVNVLLNIFLIPKYGISGAAFSSSISYWVDTLIVLWAFLKISNKSLGDVLIIKANDFKDYYNFISFFKQQLAKIA